MLGVIRLTLSKNVTHNATKEKLILGLMKILSNMYEKLSTNNKVFLMNKLFHLKMREGASVATRLNEFNMIVNVDPHFSRASPLDRRDSLFYL